MRLRTLAQLVLVVAPCLSSISWSLPLRIGAAGDSLTDEYAPYLAQYLTPMPQLFPLNPQPPSPVPAPANWVEQLAASRPGEVDFGASGSFPAPRNAGYAHNWARAGASSATLLSEGGGQDAGLASQSLDLVYVGIGTNNFAPIDFPSLGLVNVFGGIYNGCQSLTSCGAPFTGANSISYTSVEDYVADVLAEITTAVATIGASGANVVLGNVADWGDLPSSLATFPITSPGSYTGAAGRQLVSDAVDLLNIGILQLAAANDLPVVDVHALLAAGDGSLPLSLGGVAIQPGAPGSRDATYFFLPDGTHGDTLVQGLLANAFIAAANRGYGAGLTPLSDLEILANAGLEPSEDWDGTDFDANAFVAFVPEPSTGLLVMAGLLALAARRRRVGA
jgi:GDSL-like Lipase/Acylhydrolase family/PEP-CTERM motif